MIEQEAHRLVGQGQPFLHLQTPGPRLDRAQALDNEHGAQQTEGIGLGRLMEHPGRQGLGAHVLGRRLDVLQSPARGDEVRLQQAEVAMLGHRMAHQGRAQLQMILADVRRRPAHPQRPVLHLLTQVDQEGVVVGQFKPTARQLADQGRRLQPLLEIGEDDRQLP
ncbi:hypothetical protein D3C87_1478940 [compost metagenome]